MSTVVDNDKYIINGSTLSAIGDALRENNIPPKEIQTEMSVSYKTYTSPYVQKDYTRTLSASDFGLTSQTPIKVRIMVIAIQTDYGTKVMLKGAGESIYQVAESGKTYYKTLPVEITGDISFSAKMTARIYPLDNNGNYIIPTSEDDTSGYTTQVETVIIHPNRQILVSDIASLISNNHIPIDYEGLSYSFISRGSPSIFYQDVDKVFWMTFIPLTSGETVGFCQGETVGDRFRVAFFRERTYSNFQQYVTQPASSQTLIYTNGVNISGTTELSGVSLLRRFYYTAPTDGELVILTSVSSESAPIHVWRA